MAGDDLIGLSDNDVRILREMAAEHRNRGSGGTVGPYRNPTDYSSPDLYLALPPSGGIPPIDPLGTGSVGAAEPQEGDQPGQAVCEIYHLRETSGTGSDSGDFEIKRITSLNKTVYNFTRKRIERDWVPVQRLKSGQWVAMNSVSDSSGTVIYIALPNDSLGIPALVRKVPAGTGHPSGYGDDFPVEGDFPSQGTCVVYAVIGNVITLVGTNLTVHNIFRTPIPREWFIVGQDAYGKWLALHPPLVRTARAILRSTIDSSTPHEYDDCGVGTDREDNDLCVTATLMNCNGVGTWVETDQVITVCAPNGFQGILFQDDTIEVYYDSRNATWYTPKVGYVHFFTIAGVIASSCRPNAIVVQRPSGLGTYTIRGYLVNSLFLEDGGRPKLSTEPLAFNIDWDAANKYWVIENLHKYTVMRGCAYYTWCDIASSGLVSWWKVYGVGWHLSDTPANGLPDIAGNGSLGNIDKSPGDPLYGVTGRYLGETILYCPCGGIPTEPTTTTTTSTTTTTTTTPNCCSQMPSSISFELADSGDCHYSGQVVTLTRSSNTWTWSGTTACGDSLTITLTCNPSGGGTVSALTLSLNYPCAVPSTITGSIPGSCTCAGISACEATYTASGDVSACNCCTTTTTTTTTSTTTTTTTTYKCSGNPCGSCVRQWISGSWIVFSSSCTAPCLTSSASCCSPGFAGTVEGQLATVGCCKPPVYSCS